MPLMEISFAVEGNPVPKARPVTRFQDGQPVRTFTPPRTVAWESAVAWEAHRAMDGLEPFQMEVGVEMRFYRETAHACDLDNLAKAVLDAIQERAGSPGGIVMCDDNQVVEAHIYKAVDPARPRVEVRVWDMSTEEEK
jgi:Holliday junction resolvase RusA-like endonuclease